ncbi:MAG: hypothetical protein AAF645_27985 [Myxococcota bacterium]
MNQHPARRMTWTEIQGLRECRGRWVALRRCSFDAASGQATSGELVDRDADLATLCNRLRDAHFTDCSVLFCPGRH